MSEEVITAEEVADCIDAAHDEMLVRGRCADSLIGDDGSICIFRAVSLAAHSPMAAWGTTGWRTQEALYEAAKAALRSVHQWPVDFNRNASDDEVFDFLRNTAKQLREEAGQQ